jgi:hypothetical protein
MSLLEAARKQFSTPEYGTDKTDKSPSVSFVSPVPTRQDLKIEAGADWPWLESDPKALESFTYCVRTTRMLKAGKVPPDYTSTTHCKHCGEVPIFEGCAAEVFGCPWCFVGGYK